MLFISFLHETVLSTCESIIIYFLYTSHLNSDLIKNNISFIINKILDNFEKSYTKSFLKLDQRNIDTLLETIREKNIEKVNNWETSQKNIKISIIFGALLVIVICHALLALLVIFFEFDVHTMIAKNMSFVIFNAIVEIIFAHKVIKYQFL
jgi:hypothetical protein